MDDKEAAMQKQRLRVVVLTDISSLQTGFKEPDDTQSLVRLLLYANDFELEGLIATHSKHWSGEMKPDYIQAIVRQYGHVCRQLQTYDPRYPEKEELLALIKTGNPLPLQRRHRRSILFWQLRITAIRRLPTAGSC